MKRIIAVSIVALIAMLGYATYANAKRAIYTGVLGCKCHKSEMDDWKKSVHSKAYDVLFKKKRSKVQNKAMRKAGLDYKKNYDKDEKCLPCHVIGYLEPGGYEDEDSAEDLRNVGCEMCHGPGSEYRALHKEKEETFTKAEAAAMGEIYPPTEEQCRTCHDHKDSPFNAKTDQKYMFNFEEMIKLRDAWHKKYDLKFKH